MKTDESYDNFLITNGDAIGDVVWDEIGDEYRNDYEDKSSRFEQTDRQERIY